MFNLLNSDKAKYKSIIKNHTQSEIMTKFKIYNPFRLEMTFRDLSYESYSDHWKSLVSAYYPEVPMVHSDYDSLYNDYGKLCVAIDQSSMTDEGKELMMMVNRMAKLISHSFVSKHLDDKHIKVLFNDSDYMTTSNIHTRLSITTLSTVLRMWNYDDDNIVKIIQNVLLQYVNSIVALSSAVNDSYEDYANTRFNGKLPKPLLGDTLLDLGSSYKEDKLSYEKASRIYSQLMQYKNPEIAAFFEYYYRSVSDDNPLMQIQFNTDLLYVQAYYKMNSTKSTLDVDVDSLYSLTSRAVYFIIEFIDQVNRDIYYYGSQVSKNKRSASLLEDIDRVMQNESAKRLTLKKLIELNREKIKQLPK